MATRSFHLRSVVFTHKGEVPIQYTGEGDDFSPPLMWAGEPAGTEEFVLLFEEEAGKGDEPFVHWLVYRIPSSMHEIPAGIRPKDQISDLVGTPLQGMNSAGLLGYCGPMPPLFDSWHRYHFTLYALDAPLKSLEPGMTKSQILERMKSHILDEAKLSCRYKRMSFSRFKAA
jgi:Raf kinase inhibitor-like YbhB/YbcL family protein